MFPIGRKRISDGITSGLKETRGSFYHKILQNILEGVKYLDTEVGLTDDWIHHSDDGSSNDNYPLRGIWKLLKLSINNYMELDPHTLKQIINTVRVIVEFAPPERRNEISDLTDDNEKLKFRIAIR